MAPINVIDNSRSSSDGGGIGAGMMGGYSGYPMMSGYGGFPMMGGYGGYPMMGIGGEGLFGGLANLGIPDSGYLSPVLQQRIDFLKRQISKLRKGDTKTAPAAAEDAAAEDAE